MTGLRFALLCFVLVVIGDHASASAQQVVPSAKEMVIGTREAPPFAMKQADGTWSGLSIGLWDRIADRLGADYRFEEASIQDLIEGVASGRFDAAVAALTITPAREAQLDFTHPFYTTGFAIAVPTGRVAWLSLLGGLVSWEFLQATALLALVLAVVGLLFWLAERRRNAAQFGGPAVKGLWSGFWLSAVTMTTVGYGDKAPITPLGRVVALVWMFTAIIIISTFTGMIASALTADRLAGAVTGPADLPGVNVGSISGSASDEWLTQDRIGFRDYKGVREGLEALAAGEIDAFVYDEPLVRFLVNAEFQERVDVIPGTFGRQDYGIALPPASPLREPINRALLDDIESEAWSAALVRTLGSEK